MLTPKQERFCAEYLIDLNGTQAAIRAGYAVKTANEQSSRMLAKVNIQARIQKLMEKQSIRTEITADMVIAELAKIGFANVKDFVNGGNNVLEIKGLDSDKTAAVAGVKSTISKDGANITTEIKFHDKVSALEKLGRHLGIFGKDNEQRKVDLSGPFKVTIVEGDEDE